MQRRPPLRRADRGNFLPSCAESCPCYLMKHALLSHRELMLHIASDIEKCQGAIYRMSKFEVNI